MLVFIPTLLGVIALIIIAHNYATTGEVIPRGISLKGGTTISIYSDYAFDVQAIQALLNTKYPSDEIRVIPMEERGKPSGIMIETEITGEEVTRLVSVLKGEFPKVPEEQYQVEEIGSTLGEGFFFEALITLAVAFLFMGIVVYFTFREVVPSFAVILSAFFDILVTIGIVILLNMKLNASGVAAFLMLIGYSIDTDIMLTARILKRKPGMSVFDAVLDAGKTGLTMTGAALVTMITAFLLSNSAVLKQIVLIIIIGLVVDISTTWMQNAGLIRWYLEHKNQPNQSKTHQGSQ